MVKGVNKTVIEVNETGSKVFEKIVLYVSPKYGNLSAKELRYAANNLEINYDGVLDRYHSVRKRWRNRRLVLVGAIALSVVAVAAAIAIII